MKCNSVLLALPFVLVTTSVLRVTVSFVSR